MRHILLLLVACLGFAYSVFLDSSAFASLLLTHPKTRIVRDIGASRLPEIERKVKGICGNHTELETELESTKDCIFAKKLFVTPKHEYIQHIDNCTLNVRKTLKKCLAGTKYEYFPEFFLKLFKSIVTFLYDDLGVIATGLSPCMSKLEAPGSNNDYENCIARHQHGSDENSLESKAKFCEKLISFTNCFVKQINDTCTESEDLTKFKKDYMVAIEEPCK